MVQETVEAIPQPHNELLSSAFSYGSATPGSQLFCDGARLADDSLIRDAYYGNLFRGSVDTMRQVGALDDAVFIHSPSGEAQAEDHPGIDLLVSKYKEAAILAARGSSRGKRFEWDLSNYYDKDKDPLKNSDLACADVRDDLANVALKGNAKAVHVSEGGASFVSTDEPDEKSGVSVNSESIQLKMGDRILLITGSAVEKVTAMTDIQIAELSSSPQKIKALVAELGESQGAITVIENRFDGTPAILKQFEKVIEKGEQWAELPDADKRTATGALMRTLELANLDKEKGPDQAAQIIGKFIQLGKGALPDLMVQLGIRWEIPSQDEFDFATNLYHAGQLDAVMAYATANQITDVNRLPETMRTAFTTNFSMFLLAMENVDRQDQAVGAFGAVLGTFPAYIKQMADRNLLRSSWNNKLRYLNNPLG